MGCSRARPRAPRYMHMFDFNDGPLTHNLATHYNFGIVLSAALMLAVSVRTEGSFATDNQNAHKRELLVSAHQYNISNSNVYLENNVVKTVVLVGNGRSLLGKANGAIVDGHDVVGRFNFFRTKGFEKDVGQRTDLWFLNQLKLPGHRGFVGNNLRGQTDSRFDESVKPQKYLLPIVYAKPPDCGPKNTASCGPFGSKDVRKRNRTASMLLEAYAKHDIPVEIIDINIQIAMQQKYKLFSVYPSTGCFAIAYCLETYPNARISLMGFDFMHNHLGHYWEKFLKPRTVHSTQEEGKWIKGLASATNPRVVLA